ncbi:EAP30/Vps36 family-domain-containing protein [Crepidotus variabilis]|uniref:Vacuolar protein-sorting-associated protein 36 n=1 Tax=Crepidotus variabilis TaxID=179855 RepID=A0A9P6E4W0_9AGAR|nr:EAP30/Vps36 family-domain-containing protein [Crepidotus variabilis]
MALKRYTKSIDGSIPVQALLYDEEESLTSQDAVGIYDRSQKSPNHQNGTITITSHRIFYVDAQEPENNSFVLNLSHISQTEYYAGLFKSSAKVTCHLSGTPTSQSSDTQEAAFDSWECEVCAFRNPPKLSLAAARVCELCGIPRSSVPVLPHSAPLSTSLPSSSLSLSASLAADSHNSRKRTEITCPACTFLNYPSLRQCEICGTDLPKAKGELKSAPASRPLTPDPDDDDTPRFIRLSFRKGGDKSFYAMLKSSLKNKAWEERGSTSQQTKADTQTLDRNAVSTPGISGILRTVESSTQGRDSDMKDALQDLEALMSKAKDMVKIAAELNEKLTAATTAAADVSPNARLHAQMSGSTKEEPEEATFIRSSLSQLGLQMTNAPVTMDMMKDERNWLESLAKELSKVLQGSHQSNRNVENSNAGGLMKTRGIIALDEVWGGWNRARGVALIPPSTFLQVIPILPTYTSPPIHHRAFTSGLNVLHTPPYSHKEFSATIFNHLMEFESLTLNDLASSEDGESIPSGLLSEMMDAVEVDGDICRDDLAAAIDGGSSGTSAEIRWYLNYFNACSWDGQE